MRSGCLAARSGPDPRTPSDGIAVLVGIRLHLIRTQPVFVDGGLVKTIFAAFLTVVVFHATPAFAKSPTVSPLVGHWAIDVAKLPIPPEARPKSVVLDFHDPGGGKWSTQVEIVDQNGGRMHAEATLPLDGTPGPVTGNYWADVSAMKMPASNVLVVQLVDHGTPASTRVYSVSEDGRTLTETKAFFGKDGKPILQTNIFNRMP
jgi:hypothetical protein